MKILAVLFLKRQLKQGSPDLHLSIAFKNNYIQLVLI